MTEESEDEIKLKRIQIKTESGTKWFKTGQEFITWINEQRNIYSFIANAQNNHNERGLQNELNQHWQAITQMVQRNLHTAISDPEKYAQTVDNLVSHFQQQLSTKKIFTSDASFAEFVVELAETDKNKATIALAYLMDFNLSNWDLSLVKGVQAAIDWERDFHGRVEYENNALEKLRNNWDTEFGEQREQAEQSQSRIDKLTERADKLISAQKTRFDKSVKDYDGRLDKALERANDDLNNITKTYDENLALHSSVRYWGLQEKFHKSMSIGFGIATVIVAGIVFWALYCYADKFLATELKNIHVSKLVTITLITTFGIWAVRSCANLFMSYTHLRTDAQERRTMMHTYLSLLRRGQGPKDDERQLILQTLFRPSSTGMIKEDAGPSNVVDLLNRLAPGKSGST